MEVQFFCLLPDDHRRRQQYGLRRLKVNLPHQQDFFAPFITHLPAEKSLEYAHPSVMMKVASEFHAAQQDRLHGFSSKVFQKDSTA